MGINRGERGKITYYIIVLTLTLSLSLLDYYLGYPDPLVLANMSSTVTPLGHGFNVSLRTASLQDSYSYYYKPYNIDDLLAKYYVYNFNYFCDGENGSFSESTKDIHSYEGVSRVREREWRSLYKEREMRKRMEITSFLFIIIFL